MGRRLERLEAGARAAKAGLWGQPNPVPPWNWRKGDGAPQAAGVIGNRRSHVYHRPTCPGVARMSERNRVEFASAGEAEKAGYRQAGDCRPR
jgi:deoxyribonuclease-1